MSGVVRLDTSVNNSLVSIADEEFIEQCGNDDKETAKIFTISNTSAYCFQWSNHHTCMSDGPRELLEQESMLDATIVAGGEKILAHRVILSASSDLFKELLSHVNEANTTIILDDMRAEDIKSIVEFCYNGEVKIPVENINTLLEAAQLLRIRGLMDIDSLDENEIACDNDMTDDTHFLNFTELEEQVAKEESFEEVDLKFNKENTDKSINTKGRRKSQESQEIKKEKPLKKPVHKKEYTNEQLESALEDLKKGTHISAVSTKHSIPRSTLYLKAKEASIAVSAQRCEYTNEDMRGAIDAVIAGSSLQQASNNFGIPKTVLWRRIQKEGFATLRADARRTYGSERREAAKQALQRGDSLTKVAHDYQIPKTTLFRDKIRLVDEGKLPETFWRRRKTYTEGQKRTLLEEAVNACKEGKMSQAAASLKYKIPKTTIWRRLQKDMKREDSTTTAIIKSKAKKGISSVIHLGENPDLEDDFETYNADDTDMMEFMDNESSIHEDNVIILENQMSQDSEDDNFISCGLDLPEPDFESEKS